MMDEKRGLMGRKTFLSKDKDLASIMLIGISNSKTARIHTDNTELLKYWAVGLTGSPSNPSNSINFVINNSLSSSHLRRLILNGTSLNMGFQALKL